MDPNGDGRSKFLNQCKRSKDFREIVEPLSEIVEPLSEIVEPLSEMKNKKINLKKIKKKLLVKKIGKSAADYRKLKRNT
jgi:hypothetical protein